MAQPGQSALGGATFAWLLRVATGMALSWSIGTVQGR